MYNISGCDNFFRAVWREERFCGNFLYPKAGHPAMLPPRQISGNNAGKLAQHPATVIVFPSNDSFFM